MKGACNESDIDRHDLALVEVVGMIPFGTHIAAALVAGALAFGAGWQVQAWRYGEQIATIKQQHTDAALSSARNALKLTEHYRENADAAVRKAEARAAQNKRDADALRAELAGLRGDLAEVPDRIRSASREAVDQYATAATVVFDHCARRYSELAEKAQGHAATVQLLMESWPTNDNQATPAK